MGTPLGHSPLDPVKRHPRELTCVLKKGVLQGRTGGGSPASQPPGTEGRRRGAPGTGHMAGVPRCRSAGAHMDKQVWNRCEGEGRGRGQRWPGVRPGQRPMLTAAGERQAGSRPPPSAPLGATRPFQMWRGSSHAAGPRGSTWAVLPRSGHSQPHLGTHKRA